MNIRFILAKTDLITISFYNTKSKLSLNSTRSYCLLKYLSTNNSLRYFSFSTNKLKNTQNNTSKITSSLVENNNNQVSTHLSGTKRVKQAAKDTGYGIVIIIGGLTLVAIFYYLFSELFSRETPSGIYDESSKMCLDNFEVRDAFGTPIKVTAESGGRRVFQIKHKYYVEDSHLYLIINYYLEGPKNKGVVFCKVKKNETSGKFEYQSIIVKLEQYYRGQRKIQVQHKDSTVTGNALIDFTKKF